MQLLQPCLSDIIEESGSDDSGGNSPTDAVCWSDSQIEAPPVGRRRRCRTQFSGADLSRLESAFSSDPYPDVGTREQLADLLRVTEDRIQVWFQNHRAKVKRRLMMARRPAKDTTTTSRHPTHPGGTHQPPASQPSRDTQEGWQHPSLTCIPPVGSCGGFMGGVMPGGVAQRVQHAAAQGYGGGVRMPGYGSSPPGGEGYRRAHLGVSDHRREHLAADPSHYLQEELRPLTSSTPNNLPLSIYEVTSSTTTTTKDAALEKRTSPCTTNPRPGGASKTDGSRVGSSTGSSVAKFKPRRPWEDEPRGQGMKRLLQDVHVDYLTTHDVNHDQFHYVNVGHNDVAATGHLYTCIDTPSGSMHFRSPFYFPQEVAGLQCMPGLSVYPNMCNLGVMQGEQYGQFSAGWPLYKGALTARL